VGLVFFIVGAIVALGLILNNVIRTMLRHKRIRRVEGVLVFMVFGLLGVGLLVDNLRNARFDLQEQLTFLVLIPTLIIHIGITILELTRPQGLKQSRGLFTLGMTVLLIVATLSFNVVSLVVEQSSTAVARRPTPVNVTPDFADPCSQAAIASSATSRFFALISQETGLDREELVDAFSEDGTVSVATLVEQNGRDPEQLVELLKAYVDELLLGLVADECIPPIARPLALTQIEPIVEDAVYNDFDTLIQGFAALGGGGDNTTITGTPSSADLDATRRALIAQIPTEDTRPTATPSLTPTATLTPTPTITRTPLPTLSPTPTRERFVTATALPTATLPNPCLATADFNVNMRDFPSTTESAILQNIPFGENLAVYAPNDDQTWWYGEYNGIAGWVSDEFISVTRACLSLPARKP
jgi:hypothetical protein